MYTIAKRFAFSASHIIGGLPADHPCGRLHGHNYEIEVILEAPALDAAGFVRDFHELRCATSSTRRSTTSTSTMYSVTTGPRPKSSAGGSTTGARSVGRKLSPCA